MIDGCFVSVHKGGFLEAEGGYASTVEGKL
jgi:hypothetical protein